MSTHNAVAAISIRAPLGIIQHPTIQPTGREVLVRVDWTASTPLDLHINDGGLYLDGPVVLGDSCAGVVIQVGPDVKMLAVGDEVFGFCFQEPQHKSQQEFVTIEGTSFSKLPKGFTLQEAVTLPNNVVTIFHSVTKELSLPLPWPRPSTSPAHANSPILIWGGASSCGQYALQILTHWGYTNLLATASPVHHAYLRSLGASHVFDYRDVDVASDILEAAAAKSPANDGPVIPFLFDCIGSRVGSLAQLAKMAQRGSRVAVLLPVIVTHATDAEAPEYTGDVQASAEWAEGVEVRGVRTHFYAEDPFFKEFLQPTIIPALLAQGVVRPNKQKIVQGDTLLERAQNALDMLRRRETSGERLVWRISQPMVN